MVANNYDDDDGLLEEAQQIRTDITDAIRVVLRQKYPVSERNAYISAAILSGLYCAIGDVLMDDGMDLDASIDVVRKIQDVMGNDQRIADLYCGEE